MYSYWRLITTSGITKLTLHCSNACSIYLFFKSVGWEDKYTYGWKATQLSVQRKHRCHGALHLIVGGLWSTACCTVYTLWVSDQRLMWQIYFILINWHRSVIMTYIHPITNTCTVTFHLNMMPTIPRLCYSYDVTCTHILSGWIVFKCQSQLASKSHPHLLQVILKPVNVQTLLRPMTFYLLLRPKRNSNITSVGNC